MGGSAAARAVPADIARGRPQVCAATGEGLFSPLSLFEHSQFPRSPLSCSTPGRCVPRSRVRECRARRAQRFAPPSRPGVTREQTRLRGICAHRCTGPALRLVGKSAPHEVVFCLFRFVFWRGAVGGGSKSQPGSAGRTEPLARQQGLRRGFQPHGPGRASPSHRYFWAQKRHFSETRCSVLWCGKPLVPRVLNPRGCLLPPLTLLCRSGL